MTKSTHTPYYLSEQTYSRENGRAIQGTCITARTAGEPLEIIFCSLGMSHEDVKEKSAFIVKAVNCHDDLIKTVNDLIECICSVRLLTISIMNWAKRAICLKKQVYNDQRIFPSSQRLQGQAIHMGLLLQKRRGSAASFATRHMGD